MVGVLWEWIVKGKQYTILLHVDGLKMLRVNSNIVSSILSDIDAEYGNITNMTIMQGKILKYLRMTIHYSLQGKSIFYIVYNIVNILYYITEDMREEWLTPSVHHLFDISEDAYQTIPIWRRPFLPFFGAYIVPFKAITPRHTVVSIIIMIYINRYW